MPIRLPRLGETRCKCLTLCGRVESGPKAFLARLAKEKPMTARYGSGSSAAYLRLLPGGRTRRHLHVDCALPDYFPAERRPKRTHNKAQVMKLLTAAIGSTVDVGVIGAFSLPLAELPESGLMRSLYATEGETGGITIKLTAGRFSITGAPVRSIWWSVDRETAEVLVHVEARRSLRIDDRYLEEALEWATAQLSLFVLGRGANAQK